MLKAPLDNQNGFRRTCNHITVYFTFALYLSRRNVWLSSVTFLGMLGNFHIFSLNPFSYWTFGLIFIQIFFFLSQQIISLEVDCIIVKSQRPEKQSHKYSPGHNQHGNGKKCSPKAGASQTVIVFKVLSASVLYINHKTHGLFASPFCSCFYCSIIDTRTQKAGWKEKHSQLLETRWLTCLSQVHNFSLFCNWSSTCSKL